MSSFARQNITTPTRIVEISPDAVFAGLAVAALVLVPLLRAHAALLFLVSGTLLCARHWTRVPGVCLKYWYLCLLPAYCLLSFAWSEYPALSLRYGLQLVVTFVIALMITARIGPRLFSRLLFVCFGFAMIASIVAGDVRGDTGAWLGIYGSKNAMAGAAATFIVIALSQAIDSAASYRLRLAACFGILLGSVLLLKAQSVSAMAVIPPAVLIFGGLLVLYRLTLVQRVITITGAVLFTALAGLVMLIYLDAVLDMMFDLTGKDTTLTGRTELWRIARDLIAERPFFGIGYQAFWVKGHGLAEALWAQFGIDGRGGFNFHNTYLSNAVEIGIVGVALQVFVLYGGAAVTGLWALRSRSAESALMFVMMVTVIMVSFVEVPVFFQFSLRTVLMICAFAYGVQGLRELKARPARPALPFRPSRPTGRSL